MGGTQALSEEVGNSAMATSGVCPSCDEPWGGLPHAQTHTFVGVPLRRCRRCGGRFVAETGRARLLASCTGCSLPFLTPEHDDPTGQRCPDCREGRVPVDLPEPDLVAAAESEVRDALDEVWSFAHSPALSAYLNRFARVLAREIDDAPERPQVALLDDSSVRTLALPSGLLIVSVGALAAIEDEAQLAFMLAHELVHAARGDAALRLVRQGLLNIARKQDAVAEVWRDAVEDMLALGYGLTRESEADDRAFEAILNLGYDPESVLRLMVRLDGSVSDADPTLRSYFLSHPTPFQRHRRFQQILAGRVEMPGTRVNREVFRRAAGREVLASALIRVDRLDQASGTEAEPDEQPATQALPELFWVCIGVAVTAAIALIVLLLG